MGDLDPFSIPKLSDLLHLLRSSQNGLPKKKTTTTTKNKKKKDLPMKTPNLKKLAVGLLVVVGAFAMTPVSQAETAVGYKRVSVEFAFNPEAPAEKIYGDLQRRARKACTSDGVRPLALRRHDQKCVDEMVSSGVAQFGRADIAELHKGKFTVASR